MLVAASAIFAALPWKHSSACSPEQPPSVHVFVAFILDRSLLVTCNQSDSSVGGALSETIKW